MNPHTACNLTLSDPRLLMLNTPNRHVRETVVSIHRRGRPGGGVTPARWTREWDINDSVPVMADT